MIYFFYLKEEIKDFYKILKWDDNKAYVKITPKTKYKVTLNKISNYSKFINLDSFHSTTCSLLFNLKIVKLKY